MNLNLRAFRLAGLPGRFRGMFNLNDPRWGRGDDNATDNSSKPPAPNKPDEPPRGKGPNQGPPDLDELWRDFNRKLGGLFGGKKDSGRGNNGGFNGGGGGFQPDMKNAGIGIGVIAAIVVLIWLGTGFFIVQEGQQAVITRFGKYKSTVGAGFNWRLPYPIERHELLFVSQIRSVDVGRDTVIKATGLRDSAMLTEDENILDVKFSVQYRVNDARAFLFESRNPTDAVVQAAETAVREVVGKMPLSIALGDGKNNDGRNKISPAVLALMQSILNRYNIGVEVVAVNMQQGGVRPPEQVQAAFDDVNKASQERERAKNEGQAYANDVVPRAVGSASRLQEESEAYKARVVAQAQGDGQRFKSVLAEYQKAPQVTRDRMYIEAMQQIYGNVTKVMVDSRQGSNMLYLPLEKILQMNGAASPPTSVPVPDTATPAVPTTPPSLSTDARTRDSARGRDRDVR